MYDVNKKSSMKVGIDFGISFTDLSILDESEPKFISFDSKRLSVSNISKQKQLKNNLKKFAKPFATDEIINQIIELK